MIKPGVVVLTFSAKTQEALFEFQESKVYQQVNSRLARNFHRETLSQKMYTYINKLIVYYTF